MKLRAKERQQKDFRKQRHVKMDLEEQSWLKVASSCGGPMFSVGAIKRV